MKVLGLADLPNTVELEGHADRAQRLLFNFKYSLRDCVGGLDKKGRRELVESLSAILLALTRDDE